MFVISLLICLNDPEAAFLGLENFFLSSNSIFKLLKSSLEKKISPLISIILDLQKIKLFGISLIPIIFSVIFSPITPSPRVKAVTNFLFLYVRERETPSILQSTI